MQKNSKPVLLDVGSLLRDTKNKKFMATGDNNPLESIPALARYLSSMRRRRDPVARLFREDPTQDKTKKPSEDSALPNIDAKPTGR